ncbi:MAG: DUF4097 domain-containing protein [Firmicutes bacterium]|nr:DUF4097 domain-containing protein [Bacillota bacterium]
MKKSFLLIGIFVWIAVIVAAVFIMGSIINGQYSIPNYSVLLKEEEIALSGISEISIETGSLDIEFVSSTSQQLKALQYGNENTAAEQQFSITQNSGRIKISVKRLTKAFNINFGIKERLVLEIPDKWLGNVDVQNTSGNICLLDSFTWKRVNLSCSSGDMLIMETFDTEETTMQLTSGNIIAYQGLSVAEKLSIASSSGDIRLQGTLQARSLFAKSTSGNIVIERANVEKYNLHTSSGNIQVTGLSGGGKASASSGNIKLNLVAPVGNVEMDTSSGDIRLAVDADISFSFIGRCTSGDIHANFPIKKNDRGNKAEASIGDDPAIFIRAEASSGNIVIEQLM